MRLKMLSRKTSSSASDLRTSRSEEILIRMVRAEDAIGWAIRKQRATFVGRAFCYIPNSLLLAT